MKLLFVVNPISGGIDKEPFLEQAKETCLYYGIQYSIFKTTGSDDLESLKKEISIFKPTKIASVGGDGTTLFTATALLNTTYPMGIIPLGSANGMATELFVNPDPIIALKELIMSSITHGMDLLMINDQHYTLHIGDIGINANIVNSYDKDPNRGMVTYAKYFFEELQNLNTFQAKIETKETVLVTNAYMVAICNSRKYGTGIPLNIIGNPMDGKFEIVIIKQIDVHSLIQMGLTAFNEKFYTDQQSEILVTTEADIEFTEPKLLQLDGEVIGNYQNINIKILKGAVQLITTLANKNIHS